MGFCQPAIMAEEVRKAFSAPEMERMNTPYVAMGGEFMAANDQFDYMDTDTNVLNLDDGREGRSPLGDPTAQDGKYPNIDGDGSDEDDGPELSPGGILDEETVARGLSNVGRSASGQHQVYLHLALPGYALKDISILSEFVHLQKVELPYNEITDLSPLDSLEHLLILDVSNNKLTKLLNFLPPKNLKEVDMSFNMIEEMSDLSAHSCLCKLILDNNKITTIKGIEACQRLSHLSLAHNNLEQIQGLENLPIKILNLRGNKIKKIENIETLRYLQHVNLSGNSIRSMEGLKEHRLLESIDIEDNEIIDISELKYICDLPMLRNLNLLRNPLQELPDYRLSILFRIQRLVELDRRKVEVDEKVAAVNMFNSPLEVVAAKDHILHVVYNFLQPCKVWDSTLPSTETPYPMLVLVGPEGSGKKELAMKLVEEFPDYFGYGISHTTRKPYPNEEAGKDYHFVSLEMFEQEVKMGQFIQTYELSGNWYGLQMESIESIAREGLASVVHMELEGMLSLKNTYFEPRYVLIMPLTRENHERRLRESGLYSESQVENIIKRAKLCAEHNQNNPGFFDTTINSDDIQEAYRRLRRLVMDYLGINIPTPPMSEHGETTESHGTTEPTVAGQNGGSAAMGRAWSKASIADSLTLSQAHTWTIKAQSPILSGRGIVEEESLKRRQSAAKEAVAGYVPPLYEQLLSQCPRTAPHTAAGQHGLEGNAEGLRSVSAPADHVGNMDTLPPDSPDSSSASSKKSDHLSNLTSASPPPRENSPEGSEAQINENHSLPMETVDPMDLFSGGQTFSHKSGSRPQSAAKMSMDLPPPRPASHCSQNDSHQCNRPGSDRHAVLPPISPSPKPLKATATF